MKPDNGFRNITLSLIWCWLFLFALLPFGLIVLASFMSRNESHFLTFPLTLDNYVKLINPIYIHIFEKSFVIAGFSTLFCLLLGYPFAYILAHIQSRWKNFFILLVIIPFWTSSLIRSYALIAIIKAKGILNSLLITLGIIHEPIPLLFTNTAVMIGLVYNLLPFMILPIMTNIERLDNRLVDAAKDLGANRFTIFSKIIIPLTMPGIIAGIILVFLPAMTIFYITDILGGAKSILLGNLIQNQFLVAENWPMGATLSTVLTAILMSLILIYLWTARGSKNREWL